MSDSVCDKTNPVALAESPNGGFLNASELPMAVGQIVGAQPVFDLHTHLFAPRFGALNLWGIDELLNYHYLIAELFRSSGAGPEKYFSLDKSAQADLIWEELFVRSTPLSEATRGVIAVLSAFNLDTRAPDLREARAFFAECDPQEHIETVFRLAGVSDVVMTNDPLDPVESQIWERSDALDPRFHAALRTDGILNQWDSGWMAIASKGFDVDGDLTESTVAGVRRFFDSVIERMRPLYLAVSLPDTFDFPEDSARGRLIKQVILPVCRAHNLPFAMMIGVRRAVNPAIGLAGDGLGRSDMGAVNRLCAENPDVRFLVTMLSRENQHELCVSARKFSNLLPFGCWWFLNNPSIIEEITRERIELLGATFVPQHSDARILEQLIYKWKHSRRIIANALTEAFENLIADGRPVTRDEIARDAERLLSGNFKNWVGLQN
ncbi:MAG: hypothetical protein KIT57_01605 [Blastocatellales bacterium]|nr:hypothetical protein [Blastocatellales bacterium]